MNQPYIIVDSLYWQIQRFRIQNLSWKELLSNVGKKEVVVLIVKTNL